MVCFCLSQGRTFGLLVQTPKHRRNKYSQYLCMNYAVVVFQDCWKFLLEDNRTIVELLSLAQPVVHAFRYQSFSEVRLAKFVYKSWFSSTMKQTMV